MKPISDLGRAVLFFGAAGLTRTSIAWGIHNINDRFALQNKDLTHSETRSLNLRILAELVDAGLIEIVAEHTDGALPAWPLEPEKWIPTLATLWPDDARLPDSVGFWLAYIPTEAGMEVALAPLPKPEETVLIGQWIAEGGQVRGDATCERIEWLTANHLIKIAISTQGGGWETLFQSPVDERYWERTYPQGAMHGGGPPALKCISKEQARSKYGNDLA